MQTLVFWTESNSSVHHISEHYSWESHYATITVVSSREGGFKLYGYFLHHWETVTPLVYWEHAPVM
uniref:Uncharacterized protein n=1 Tax=Anguilla anguilla TaxID=7936 RepID=A0A0E9QUF7_ANGAN